MKVAVLGYGTVGSGVVEVLEANAKSIAKKAGEAIEVKSILDIREFKGDPWAHKITKDFNTILLDNEIQVIAEAMGGIEPAYGFIKQALKKGKSVVTSNKELVASHGPELLALAKENNANFLFEASVGGGIPVIRPLNSALTADEIVEVTGILNGTTNFILTKMNHEGREFNDVLIEAQELGYAERNPAADVEGYDACRKIAILSSLAFGQYVDYKDVPTEGITHITQQDMDYAKAMGYAIKLLGTCKKNEKGIFARVAPVMIGKKHPLTMVEDVFNAVFIHGNMVGDVMFYGKGAGKLPTASAMVGDIIDAVRHPNTTVTIQWDREKINLMSGGEISDSYFICLEGSSMYLKERVYDVFGEVEEIKALKDNQYAFITHEIVRDVLEEKLKRIEEIQVSSLLRIEK